ncbi:hypothetical protein ScPMuIL_012942 [Solemya velum]
MARHPNKPNRTGYGSQTDVRASGKRIRGEYFSYDDETRATSVHYAAEIGATSAASVGSDFDELTPISDTPDDFVDTGVDYPNNDDDDCEQGVIIPFSSLHQIRDPKNCWIPRLPVNVKIIKVEQNASHSYLNPYLYTIRVSHGDYTWEILRRYKHFANLQSQLVLYESRINLLPVPTRQNRQRRQSLHKEPKATKAARFPKKPEILIREENLEKRKEHLEKYLQSILKCKLYKNHSETVKFLEVSSLSFVNKLGKKWKEGLVMKCSGGRRISIGCCGCLKKFHFAGRWSKRWLVVKDTFLTYIRPKDGAICDVLLMDHEFKVEIGMGVTGAHHGLMVSNKNRNFLAKCWTARKAEEWKYSIEKAAKKALDFTEENRYGSYAPVREDSYVRWFVDGSSYFEAVADALEKAKEEIFITDWWLSPEIYLKRPMTDRDIWRLDNIIKRKAEDGVKVFIILYKEMEIALTINSRYSKHKLISQKPENIKILRHPDHIAGGVYLWAHHEKIVVIDQRIAFLGGLDLCYGRWDDCKHGLTDLGSKQPPTSQNGSGEETGTRASHVLGHSNKHAILIFPRCKDTKLHQFDGILRNGGTMSSTESKFSAKKLLRRGCTVTKKTGLASVASPDSIKIQFTPELADNPWSCYPGLKRDQNISNEKSEQCVCYKSAEQRHSYSNNSLEGDEPDLTTDSGSQMNVEVTVHPPSDVIHTDRATLVTDNSNHQIQNFDNKNLPVTNLKVNSKKICSTDIDSVPDDFVYSNHSSQHKLEKNTSEHSIGRAKRHSSKKTSNIHFNKEEIIKEESIESNENQTDDVSSKDKKPLETTSSVSLGPHKESLLMRRLHTRLSQKEAKDDKEENNNDEDGPDGPSPRTDIINRWRLVLNVQKFESAIRNPQARTADAVPDSVILPELKNPTYPWAEY